MSELEIFLNEIGIIEKPKKPAHAPVYIKEDKPKYVAWKPSYPGEDPPF